jgi:long-subunit acyl-CoA synthetase (AMP-forming)
MTISPRFWVTTGDCGRWVQDGRFEVLGRASRQLQVKGRKFPVEPIELKLSLALDAEQFALLQDRQGRVSCVFVSHGSSIDSKIGLLAKINHLIHQTDPEFPGVSRVMSLKAGAWPLMPSGKTDWQALTDLLDALT